MLYLEYPIYWYLCKTFMEVENFLNIYSCILSLTVDILGSGGRKAGVEQIGKDVSQLTPRLCIVLYCIVWCFYVAWNHWLFSNGTSHLTWTPNHVESAILSPERHFSDPSTDKWGLNLHTPTLCQFCKLTFCSKLLSWEGEIYDVWVFVYLFIYLSVYLFVTY